MAHKLSPPYAARRNLMHFIILGWYETLCEAAVASVRFRVFSSPEGRKLLYSHNQGKSRLLGLQHGKQFPLVNYRLEDPPVRASTILASLVRDAMYVSHTGNLPGPNRKRRDALLKKWGYVRA